MSDLAAQCPTSAGLLRRALTRRQTRSGWWEILLPILLEALQAFLEACIDNQTEFVESVRRANRRDYRELAIACRRAMREANREESAVPTRLGKARQLAGDILHVCDEAADENLAASYTELAA